MIRKLIKQFFGIETNLVHPTVNYSGQSTMDYPSRSLEFTFVYSYRDGGSVIHHFKVDISEFSSDPEELNGNVDDYLEKVIRKFIKDQWDKQTWDSKPTRRIIGPLERRLIVNTSYTTGLTIALEGMWATGQIHFKFTEIKEGTVPYGAKSIKNYTIPELLEEMVT